MKSTELRIGNLVWSNYGRYDRLEDYVVLLHEDFLLTKGHGKSNIAFHFIEPIPITPGWTRKMGFQPRGDGSCVYKEFGDNLMDIERTGETQDPCGFELYMYSMEIYDIVINGAFVCSVSSVHQLQNLYFALTGEELTIKEQ